MFIHTGNHTLVYQPFPVARLQQSITKHKTSSSTHTQKKKVLPKAEANVSKKKKKIRIPDVKTWVRVALYLSLKKIGGCQAQLSGSVPWAQFT